MIDEHTKYFATEFNPGISVRDKLAESAMMGLMSQYPSQTHNTIDQVSKAAYEIADAMIAQSNK